jgi:hypothetical protein
MRREERRSLEREPGVISQSIMPVHVERPILNFFPAGRRFNQLGLEF